MTLREKLKNSQILSPIMETRTKAFLKDIIEEKLTWIDFDVVELPNKKGEKEQVPIVLFKEYPDNFFFGGKAFRDLISLFDEDDKNELKEKGIIVEFDVVKVKNDPTRSFTRVKVI